MKDAKWSQDVYLFWDNPKWTESLSRNWLYEGCLCTTKGKGGGVHIHVNLRQDAKQLGLASSHLPKTISLCATCTCQYRNSLNRALIAQNKPAQWAPENGWTQEDLKPEIQKVIKGLTTDTDSIEDCRKRRESELRSLYEILKRQFEGDQHG